MNAAIDWIKVELFAVTTVSNWRCGLSEKQINSLFAENSLDGLHPWVAALPVAILFSNMNICTRGLSYLGVSYCLAPSGNINFKYFNCGHKEFNKVRM